jgi:hypothetical protein
MGIKSTATVTVNQIALNDDPVFGIGSLFPDEVWVVIDPVTGKSMACCDRSKKYFDGNLVGLAVTAEENDARQLSCRLGFGDVQAMTFDEARQQAQIKGLKCVFLVDGVLPASRPGEVALNITACHFVA